jgi:hypothetical protein
VPPQGPPVEAELTDSQQRTAFAGDPTAKHAARYLHVQRALPPLGSDLDPDHSITLSRPSPELESLTFVHASVEMPTTAISVSSHMAAISAQTQVSTNTSWESEPHPAEPSAEGRKTVLGWLASRVSLYGAAELAGSITAAIGIGLTGLLYPNAAAVGLVGTMSENVGLYAALFYSAMSGATRSLAAEGKSHTLQTRAEVVGNLVAQFGMAEVFDSLLIRPALIGSGGVVGWYLGEHLLGQGAVAMATGAFGCKVVADVVYWSMVEATGAALSKVEKKN